MNFRKLWPTMLFWLFLNIGIMVFMDLALFMQTTPEMKNASFLKKLLVAELLATIEWVFIIPSNKFLTAAQVALTTFIFDFIGQIGTNKFWLKLPTTIDDYAAMIIIFIGMAISAYKVFG